jgi:hypothetical protein
MYPPKNNITTKLLKYKLKQYQVRIFDEKEKYKNNSCMLCHKSTK